MWAFGEKGGCGRRRSKDSRTILCLLLQRSVHQGILGLDYTFFDDLYASAQYLWSSRGSALSPYGQDDKAQSYLILQGRYTHWDHELELIGMTNIGDGSWVLNPKYSYRVGPAVKVSLGGRFFYGAGDSNLARG